MRYSEHSVCTKLPSPWKSPDTIRACIVFVSASAASEPTPVSSNDGGGGGDVATAVVTRAVTAGTGTGDAPPGEATSCSSTGDSGC